MSDTLDRLRAAMGRPSLDTQAAKNATKLAGLTVVVLSLLQMGVTAAVTTGGQPMAAVDSVPAQPQSDTWSEAPSRTVDLSKQQMALPYGGGSVDELTVKSLTNDTHVGFRLSWADTTRDANINSPENYSDAAAVMFGTGEVPPIMMGNIGTPVNIWYWRAAWDQNTSAYGSGGMYNYPNERAGGPTKPGLSADNPLTTHQGQAQNYFAEGFGSLSYAPDQPVSADGTRTDDGWAVTFIRERGAGGDHDVTFSESTDIYLAFAVWNGSVDEVNGQKSITLRFTELDPESGALSAVEQGSDSQGSTPTDGGGGGSDFGSFTGWMGVFISCVLMVWLVSYWRMS